MGSLATQENQVSLVLRATRGCRAQKVSLELRVRLVYQALWAWPELKEWLGRTGRLDQEVPLEYQAPEAPLGHKVFQDSLALKAIRDFQALLAQLV